MLTKFKESTDFIIPYLPEKPKAAIVLGTGLGGFEKEITITKKINYSDIPNFPISTVEGHQGALIIGHINNVPVIAMQGRFHFYEGYTMEEVIYPIRLMYLLGIEYLFLSNATGGMNPSFKIGDIMVINDHINLMPNPLIGKHNPEFGPRFPDMSEPYDKSLIKRSLEIAKTNNIKLHEGCYVAVTGPTYETPKEYEYFRIIGGDNIGMSTAPEAIAAAQMKIKCFAISVITDLGIPGMIEKVTHEEVQKAANEAEWKISKIIQQLVSELT